MELSFVLNAMKRYWWVVVAFFVLGTVGGMQITAEGVAEYRSKTVILIAAPSDSLQQQFAAGADRYLQGQMKVFQSTTLAEKVAERVGGGLTAEVVSLLTTIEQSTGTDVVEITAASSDPTQAQEIADAFAVEYFAKVEKQINDAQEPALLNLNQQLADLNSELATINDQISEKLAPYLANVGAAVPDLGQIDPKLADDRNLLLAHYDRVSLARDQLELNSKLRVSSQVIQPASKAALVIPTGGKKKLYAAVIAGFLAGAVAASALASVSKRALDEHDIAEVLGVEVVGVFPKARSVVKNRRVALESLPARMAPFIDKLNVRAEANARIGEAFTVVVVGTERASGTTTLAEAMANRFAANGSRVLLVDADTRDSELTRLFAAGAPGIPALLAYGGANTAAARRPATGLRLDPFSATSVAGLSVVGIGDKSGSSSLRRQNVPDLIEAAKNYAHVVVFDGGPLLDAASTVQLSQLVDAVVLTVPMRKQLTRSLATIKAQMHDCRGEILPVLVPAGRRRGAVGPKAPPAAAQAFGLAGRPDVEQFDRHDPMVVTGTPK